VTGQETGERGLTTTYISCYCDMHINLIGLQRYDFFGTYYAILSIFFVRHCIFFELIGKIGARKY
jgi:hypothetical protein